MPLALFTSIDLAEPWLRALRCAFGQDLISYSAYSYTLQMAVGKLLGQRDRIQLVTWGSSDSDELVKV